MGSHKIEDIYLHLVLDRPISIFRVEQIGKLHYKTLEKKKNSLSEENAGNLIDQFCY